MFTLISLFMAVFCFWYAGGKRSQSFYRDAFRFVGGAFICIAMVSFAKADSLSLITLDRSYHYDRDGGHNEKHGGLGLEYSPNEDWSYGFMNYKNSFNKDTTAIHFTYKNLLLGLADGYDAHKSMVVSSDDIIIIGGLNLNLDLIEVDQYSLGLRTLITPSVSAIGLNLTVDLE